uniref:Uncharacterized protein LOC104223238 n=1 Tax=Nicotiana sylvestris TaxID=4096 RepID=A0A1U7WE61_NICSY|nr:PREDICTED: uncharacterized protein LOC104223238 [Nicotiana sylvestris]
MADALSRKSMGSLAHLEACQRPLAREVHRLASLGIHLVESSEGGVIVQNRAELLLVVEVKEKQYDDPLAQFTTNFWKRFQQGLSTQVNLSTTFHPQNDGQPERTIQMLEDMLRACVFVFKGS